MTILFGCRWQWQSVLHKLKTGCFTTEPASASMNSHLHASKRSDVCSKGELTLDTYLDVLAHMDELSASGQVRCPSASDSQMPIAKRSAGIKGNSSHCSRHFQRRAVGVSISSIMSHQDFSLFCRTASRRNSRGSNIETGI